MLARISAAVVLAMSVSAIMQARHAADQNAGLSAFVPGTGPTEYLPDPLFAANLQRWSDAVEPGMDAPSSNALFYTEMIRGKALAEAALQADAPGAKLLALSGARYALTLEPSAARTIRVPIAAWPYWTAETARGEALTVSQDEALGILSIDVPAGAERIELRLGQSPWEQVGMWTSLISFLIWICAVMAGRFRSLPRSQPQPA